MLVGLVFASLAASSVIAPADAAASDDTIHARNPAGNSGVYACNNVNFGQPCTHVFHPYGTCNNFEEPFAGNLRSVGPDKGSVCQFWIARDCKGVGSGDMVFPGRKDLGQLRMANKLKSYICWSVPT